MANARPKLAVWKFTSCDGCQLSLLDLGEDLLALASEMEIAYFMEARREFAPGPYDISLVEGSISTPEEVERIRQIRAETRFLIPFGVCATRGGIQALRNYASLERYEAMVYSHPLVALPTSTPIQEHVKADFLIQGCPPNRYQLRSVLVRLLAGGKPWLPTCSVCLECKRDGKVCVLVAKNIPCLGPATHDGCGALCPGFGRDCYGCFGPMDDPHPESLAREYESRGLSAPDIVRRFREITPHAEGYNRGAKLYEPRAD